MNITSLVSLLQAAASLLVLAQGPTATTAFMQQAVSFGSHAVQIVTQAEAPIGFSVPQNDSVWPNAKDLMNAPYIDAAGHWSQLGKTVQLIPGDTSFGDLNHDGLDDAAVIVNRPSSDGTPNYFLAAMLNQNNIMFNIADFPLGTDINIASHSISGGMILLSNTSYELLGNTIIKN
jgi:hypothetical protein